MNMSPKLGWEWKPGYSGPISESPCSGNTCYIRSFDQHGFDSEDYKKIVYSQNPKIVIGCDSLFYSYNIEKKLTFPFLLEEMLKTYDVINMGVFGYSAFQCKEMLLQKVLPIEPAIVILSFGFNDRRLTPYRSEDSHITFLKNYFMHATSKNFYFLKLIEMIKNKMLNSSYLHYNVNDLKPRLSLKAFSRNLLDIIEILKAKNIKLVFLYPTTDPILSKDLIIGIEHFHDSNFLKAKEYFINAIKNKNLSSGLARKYLAMTYEKMNLHYKAKDILLVKNFPTGIFGGDHIAQEMKYYKTAKKLAHENNIIFLDTLDFKDSSFYSDNYSHLSTKGHKIVAEKLYSALEKKNLFKINDIFNKNQE